MKDEYPKVSALIKIFCFKEDIINKCKSKTPKIEKDIIFIEKSILDIYKNNYKYNELSSYLTKNNNILNCIKENNKIKFDKLNDNNIHNIIQNIKKDEKKNLVERIEAINSDKILNEIYQEDSKKWYFKLFIFKKDKNKGHRDDILKLIDNIDIINSDILNLLNNNLSKKQKISIKNFYFGNCTLVGEKIFAYFLDVNNALFEIGSFINGNLKIDYILKNNELENSTEFLNISNNEINEILKNISQNKDIIFVPLGNKKICCYKVNENQLMDEENYFQNYCNKFDKKVRDLVLLSVFQNIYLQNKNKEEEVVLLNKNYFDEFKFSQIHSLITNNKKIKNLILNINSQNISINLINEIIFLLDKDELKTINNTIDSKKINNISYNPKQEEIILLNSKKITINDNFILINPKEFNNYLASDFKINLVNQNASFIIINKKNILKINDDKQHILFIGNINNKNYLYEIEKILDFEDSNDLNSELKFLESIEIDSYYKERSINNNEDGYISPIFSSEKIIGYSYNYNKNIL